MSQKRTLIVLSGFIAFLYFASILCEATYQSTFYIGRVANKQYFVLRDKQSWIQSKASCEKANFQLATIRTDEELQFLVGRFEDAIFHGWHWIAARDSRQITQFVWDHGDPQINIKPTLIVDGSYNSTATFLTCGAFQINDNGYGVLMVDCSKNNGYVLCELNI